jgi:hypothetical protein
MLIALLAGLSVAAPDAQGAPCASACKDEVAACVKAECQNMKPRARRHCRRLVCLKPIVQDCYADLSVCGATTAKPPAPGKPAPTPGGW